MHLQPVSAGLPGAIDGTSERIFEQRPDAAGGVGA